MAPTCDLRFNGTLLQRGFWLYVWEITSPKQTRFYYVGRTGDSSSNNAQSPFNRMAQHLGFKKESNALRRCLTARGVRPEDCNFKLVAHGPILKEGTSIDTHRECRDKIAAMEKALADAMAAAGHDVVNAVNCRIKLDSEMFFCVLDAFSRAFPKMSKRMESNESR